MSIPPPTERQARFIWLALTGLAMAVIVGLIGGLIWALGRVIGALSPVIWPLAIAGVVACLLNPAVDFFERRTRSRKWAIVAVFGIAMLMMFGLGASVVPQLVKEAEDLALQIPGYAARAEKRFKQWIDHPPAVIGQIRSFLANDRTLPPTEAEPGGTNAPSAANQTNAPSPSMNAPAPAPSPGQGGLGQDEYRAAAEWLAKALPDVGAWLLGQLKRVASWFGLLAGLGLIPVYAFYFLLEQRGIAARWTDYLPVKESRFKEELVFVLNAIKSHLIAFFRGQVLVAICDGILYGLGFLIVGLPYALLIGVVAMAITIIPYLGASWWPALPCSSPWCDSEIGCIRCSCWPCSPRCRSSNPSSSHPGSSATELACIRWRLLSPSWWAPRCSVVSSGASSPSRSPPLCAWSWAATFGRRRSRS